MSDETRALFEDLPAVPVSTPKAALPKAPARVLMPNRQQIELRPSDLESLLPEGHRARLVWAYVERQDLRGMYAAIKALDGGAGRAAIAPEILFALWLYATLEGIGSARELARLTDAHDAYRWICGGVRVNYHTLSDFRTVHGEVFEQLLTDNLAALMATGAVTLRRVAQDGVRVRASAGAASFRRRARLESFLDQAREQVDTLKQQLNDDPGAMTRREQAARARAAKEREARIQQALDRLPELAAIKQRRGKEAVEARASTTDAEASVMKMGDGGFRPAYNVQYATDTQSQVIVGAAVATQGTDQGELSPMLEQVIERTGRAPHEWLVDGGYPAHAQLEAVAEKTTVYAPVPQPKKKERDNDSKKNDDDNDPHAPKPTDSEAIAAWRIRMGSEEAKEIYKDRAATAECVNAQARNRGLTGFRVRGKTKVTGVTLLFALAHNLMRTVVLAPQLLGLGVTPSTVDGFATG